MSRRQISGFTLIELTIVVAIIGFLMTIGYGYYRDNVISSNRTVARAALQQAAGTLEKCKSIYGSYNHANCNYANFVSEQNFYAISVARNATTFTLTATPQTGYAQAGDTDCTTLTLTNTGIKGSTGGGVCW